MAKPPVTTHTTPPPPPVGATGKSDSMADALAAAQRRIADLEELLAAARDLAMANSGKALEFKFPLLDDVDQAFGIARELDGRLGLGNTGHRRRLAWCSLLRGLERVSAKLADGTPVHRPHHAIVWLLDNLRLDQA